MISIVRKDLKNIEKSLLPDDHKSIIHVDFSHNSLSTAEFLVEMKCLKTLVIDNNKYFSLDDFPRIASLETFSANSNYFANLNSFLTQFELKFPNCVHLSLLNNPICPFFESEDEYKEFKAKIRKKLPKIQVLDGMPIYEIEKSNKKSQPLNSKGKIEEEEEKSLYGQGTIEYDRKFSNKPLSKSLKSKSEGNRYVTNENL